MADLLPRIEPLLLKAEALDLVEVLAGLEGDNVVRRHTVDGPGKQYFKSRCGRGFACFNIFFNIDPGLLSSKLK